VKTLVICSGGLDSVTHARKVAAEQTLTHFVSFHYGSAITDAAAPALSDAGPFTLPARRIRRRTKIRTIGSAPAAITCQTAF